MNIHGARSHQRSHTIHEHAGVFEQLARYGLLPGRPQPGETLPVFAGRALEDGLRARFPESAVPTLRLEVAGHHLHHHSATLEVSYEPVIESRGLSAEFLDATDPLWLQTVMAYLSTASSQGLSVWTPYDAWHYYTREWGDFESFRRHCAVEQQVPEKELTDRDVQDWAAAFEMLDPWTVARLFRLDPGRKLLSLPALERQAATPLHRRIAEQLAALVHLDWRLPAGHTSQKQPCPHVIVFYDGDDGLCLELAAEVLDMLDTGPALRVNVDPGGLRVFNTYARNAQTLFRRTEALLDLLQEL
ncbi:hypothetical protein [Deinococcus budaensis]|uniref:PRTRC system protein F n=1 Tax=Deinococcus budaensis TaxID=1665626 RepID=A0A7W8GFB2_9DEIO|nr:hypothetical protein [Deinococcus budaensis]MBB5234233.1 hypothetical protein [Deinococcus budaensis]